MKIDTNKSAKLKCAVYARVSTEDQNTSIVNQHEYFTEYINRNKWELFDIYTDEAFTGTESKKRLSFQRLLEDGKNKSYDILLAKSYSRFGRNQRETLNALAELFAIGIRIIFIEDGLDSQRDKGQFGLFAWLAEQEARKVSERIKLVWQHYNNQGKIHVCNPPYGYDYSEDIKNFVINEEETKIVKRIFSMYIQGYGMTKIANILREEGIKTKKGGNWANPTIRGMLTNQMYIGNLVQGKSRNIDVTIKTREKINPEEWIIHMNNHEPIISKETFLKVQKLIEERSAYSNNFLTRQRHSSTALFSNLIKCKQCGSTFTIKRQKHFNNYAPYYTCVKYELQGKKGANHERNSIYEDAIIACVRDELIELEQNDFKKIKEYFKKLRKEIEEKSKPQSIEKEILFIDKQIKEHTDLSMSLINAYSKGLIGDAQLKLQNETIEKNLQILLGRKEELLQSAKNTDINIDEEEETIRTIQHLLSISTEEWTNELMKVIISKITVGLNCDISIDFKYQNYKYSNLLTSKYGNITELLIPLPLLAFLQTQA